MGGSAIHQDDWLTIHGGDCREVLSTLPDESVQCVVTSPPYWGLRDYGVDGQLGLERTPDEYVAAMVDVFREVRRVLRRDGTLWLNLGDSYAHDTKGTGGGWATDPKNYAHKAQAYGSRQVQHGLKPKDLVGIPWRVAFALQADGWYLRSDIIWAKPNPMPESVTDRPTKAHEYLFLLSRSERYMYDAAAVMERGVATDAHGQTGGGYGVTPPGQKPQVGNRRKNEETGDRRKVGFNDRWDETERVAPERIGTRNRRSVWTVATQPYPGAHFATFPEALVEPCILAGCPEGGVVLDPFAGTGTVGVVAQRLSRRAVLIDLNPDYLRQCLERNQQAPLGLAVPA